jgi:taurine dioxygenase
MAIEVVPCSPVIGAEIRGIDLSQGVNDSEFAAIIEAWHRYQVILLRNQNLPTEEQQVAFASRFGELAEVHVQAYQGNHPAVMYIGNLKDKGKSEGALPVGEMEFHIDQCYQQRPAKGTMLYAIEIPSAGGETVFANGYKAYEQLPDAVKAKIKDMKAVHVYDYGGKATDRKNMVSISDGISQAHPIARTHPATGRKSLFVNKLMTHSIAGMEHEESEALLNVMFDTISQPELSYVHEWQVGDLLLWDNRCTLHARRDFDPNERRWLRRVTILGDVPV